MPKLNFRHLLSSAAMSSLLAMNAPVSAVAQAAGAPAAPPTAPVAVAPMTGQQVIELLDQTIDWYRTLGIQQQAANEPGDLLILYDNRQMANRVVALAFEIAREQAEILARQPGPKDADGASASSQSLTQLHDKFTAQGATIQTELESSQSQLAKARPEQRVVLQAKVSELQGELDLVNARTSLLATMSALISQGDNNGSSAGALKAQIDAMAVTVGPASPNTTPPGSIWHWYCRRYW